MQPAFADDAAVNKTLPEKKSIAQKPPTELPKYKVKKTKKIQIDFENPAEAGMHTTTVNGRTALPLDVAMTDQKNAENEVRKATLRTRQETEPRVVQKKIATRLPEKTQGKFVSRNNSDLSQPAVIIRPEGSSKQSIAITAIPSQPKAPVSPSDVFEVVPTAPTPHVLKPVPLAQLLAGSATPPPVATPPPPEFKAAAPQVLTRQTAPQNLLIAEPSPTPKSLAPFVLVQPPAPQVSATPYGTPAPSPTPVVAPQPLFAAAPTPGDDTDAPEINRFYLRASYLDARYSHLESDLENGATTFGGGVARTRGDFEGRVILEIGHGLDQAVIPQNTRIFAVRGDVNYEFLKAQGLPVAPIAGIGLGYTYFNVFSVRSDNGTTQTIRINDQTTSITTSPAVGIRLKLPKAFTLDLTAEYLLLLSGGESASLGGLAGALSLGVPF